MKNPAPQFSTLECRRLHDADAGRARWKFWGPYLAERAWGTVREDYSPDGAAWEYFTYEQAASRAYRWNEDGLAGISDEHSRLCLALALWNGQDPLLKERLFGLTNHEGNHGEDVKELYYYLDATPTHSYLKMLYKYPQRPFPYEQLRTENKHRTREQAEFELLDTGTFDDNRYFDVFVEHAKASPSDLLMLVTVHNRGPDDATLQVLPHLWFRNRWSWDGNLKDKPALKAVDSQTIDVAHHLIQGYQLHVDVQPNGVAPALLFCENESNSVKLYGAPPSTPYPKDAVHRYIVDKQSDAVNPARVGTKAAAQYVLNVPAGGSQQVRIRLTADKPQAAFADFDAVMSARRREADDYHAALQQGMDNVDAKRVHRQSLAGMIWSKQYYHYDVRQWLNGDSAQPAPPPERKKGRNKNWHELNNADIISMPDKWEYPWYAAWDLAFHCIPLAMVDAEFAKQQLLLLTREWYMHSSGQLPAYEWALEDVNPPVQAWAAYRVFQIDRKQRGGVGDIAFLERVFHKLMLNFTWWVNRKDAQGRNIFQGGFLGLDNIGVFNRSEELPGGATLEQADATAWMAMYCLNLMRIAIELAQHNPVYEDIATKFFEHFLHIAEAMTNMGGNHGLGLWDEQDEFYYDSMQLPTGQKIPMRVRSMVGLIPLFAIETIEPETLAKLPDFNRRLMWVMKYRPDLAGLVSRWHEPGLGERRMLSLLRGHRMKRLLSRLLDETEFLSDYGVRSLSKQHAEQPFEFYCSGSPLSVSYVPGEAETGMFGGNSNWRGPIWMPVNYLIIESLQKFHHYYGDDFTVECPTGSGKYLTLSGVADELTRRLTRLFLRDEAGNRAVFGDSEKEQQDPHFRDYIPFYEYFHGETGRGLGASHQTGWTGLIAKLLQPRDPEIGACPQGKPMQEETAAK
jgi:hypothetical protein